MSQGVQGLVVDSGFLGLCGGLGSRVLGLLGFTQGFIGSKNRGYMDGSYRYWA